VGWPPLRVVRFSGRALSDGVEKHRIEGEDVRVYSLAKTIADCFKYRNKVGLDVALEALKDAWTRKQHDVHGPGRPSGHADVPTAARRPPPRAARVMRF
jgi:hypothetical protein